MTTAFLHVAVRDGTCEEMSVNLGLDCSRRPRCESELRTSSCLWHYNELASGAGRERRE